MTVFLALKEQSIQYFLNKNSSQKAISPKNQSKYHQEMIKQLEILHLSGGKAHLEFKPLETKKTFQIDYYKVEKPKISQNDKNIFIKAETKSTPKILPALRTNRQIEKKLEMMK